MANDLNSATNARFVHKTFEAAIKRFKYSLNFKRCARENDWGHDLPKYTVELVP